MRAIYRVRQFLLAAGAWIRPEKGAEREVGRVLPPEAVKLFQQMPSYDRRHALRVWRALQEQGYGESDLLAAALLHDVGKTAQKPGRLRLWHRVAVVLLNLRPGLLERVAGEGPRGWRQPFFVQQHHAALGAEWARRAGCSPATVALIERHEDPPQPAGDRWLAALQAADDAN